MIFTKNKEGVRAIRAMKYTKCVAGKYTRARAPLAQTCTNRIFETNNGTTSMKIVNYIERHNFCWNDLLTKSNRTEIQTYKLEERTFGTPCAAVEGLTQAILSFFFLIKLLFFVRPRHLGSLDWTAWPFKWGSVCVGWWIHNPLFWVVARRTWRQWRWKLYRSGKGATLAGLGGQTLSWSKAFCLWGTNTG